MVFLFLQHKHSLLIACQGSFLSTRFCFVLRFCCFCLTEKKHVQGKRSGIHSSATSLIIGSTNATCLSVWILDSSLTEEEKAEVRVLGS